MPVDSFKYLPRLIAAYYQSTNRQPELPSPWTPLRRPLSECTFGLVTSGGVYEARNTDPVLNWFNVPSPGPPLCGLPGGRHQEFS